MAEILGTYVEVEISYKDETDWDKEKWAEELVEDDEAAENFVKIVKINLRGNEKVTRVFKNILVKCDCGEEVLCTSNTNVCDVCEELYNRWGQHLAPREEWGHDTDENPYTLYNL